MKIAVTGKGGVGKTTLAATLAKLFAKDGYNVIALDADPDANLAQTLGISEEKQKELIPIAEMKTLINERTGKDEDGVGNFFRLNPKVDDIPQKYALNHEGIKLLVLGKVHQGGSGCYCPENVFLKSLLSHLIIQSEDIVIVDMEAGIEHLTRGSSRSVDFLIVVVEPGTKSLQTAKTIYKLAKDLGIKNIYSVGNKILKDDEKEFLKNSIPEIPFLGFIPYKEKIIEADLKSIPPYQNCPELVEEVQKIKDNLILKKL
ncbi:MAG: AAA family ATPase [Candidatus Firestonebacteria bacterium]|nr:AAA family ATPase [Candidatus Firestonebacteria bacterium]